MCTNIRGGIGREKEENWYKCKKPGKNPRQKRKILLTNEMECDKMVLHSVILCPQMAILIYGNIISQNMAAVKRKVS